MNWTLLNPWWLLFGTAALLPLILFLLRRRTPQLVEWGAMQFLVDATRMPSARRRWKQWLLLALRMALPLLVAIVAATPGCRNEKLSTTPLAPPTHWILIFDLSASMGERADGSGWAVAKSEALNVVAEAKRGDTFSILSSGKERREPWAVRNSDKSSVRDIIHYLQTGGDRFDALRMIEQTRQLISTMPADTAWNFQVVVFSDFQIGDWPGLIPGLDAPGPGETRFIPCGPADVSNVSIQNLVAVPATVTTGQTFECRANIVNDSPDPVDTNVQLIYPDGVAESVTQKVSLGAGESKTVSFPVTALEAGTIDVQASIDNLTGIFLGKSQYLTVDVRPSIDVLCLEGSDGASKSFVAATTPVPNSRLPVISSTIAEIESVPSIDLNTFDVVAVLDVAKFTDRELKPLVGFVNAGGRLLLSMGEGVDTESWSELLRASTATPTGLPTFDLKPDPVAGDFRFDPLDYQHPVTSDFRDEPRAGLIDVPVQRYYQIQLYSPSQDFEPVLRYDNGDIAVLAINIRDRGRILVSTTPLSAVSGSKSWNELPAWWSYVPIVNNAIVWLFGDTSRSGRWHVGESRNIPLGPDAAFDQVRLRIPGEDPRFEPVSVTGNGRKSLSLTPRMPGFVRIQYGVAGTKHEDFAVNMADEENDLRQADLTELKRRFPEMNATPGNPTMNDRPRRSTRFYLAALFVIAALMLLEPFLANRNRNYRSRNPA